MFFKTIERNSDIIKGYRVSEHTVYGSARSLVATLDLADGSSLRVKDYLFLDGSRKYSYHWQDNRGRLVCRWDNSSHHSEIATHPHHKHVPDSVVTASGERDLDEVLAVIRRLVEKV
ncbi:MAG: hypothetical protein HY897_19425 [Deltaproteobacteria bacterium]|nr:hypothetical protein [Deltaproteobacteria bacterium]